MNDFFQKDPNGNQNVPKGTNPWQQDPFAAYDDPSIQPAGSGALPGGEPNPYAPPAPGSPDYSAWRRPAPVSFSAPRQGAPDGAAYPPEPEYAPQEGAPYQPVYAAGLSVDGSEDADFGVVSAELPPLSGFAQDPGFAAMGADAPTRIARPIQPAQQVNKHKTVERGVGGIFQPRPATAQPVAMPWPETVAEATADATATPDAAPRHRRVSRAARHEEPAAQPAATEPENGYTPAAPAPVRAPEPPRTDFDPFEAGDSETAAETKPADEAEDGAYTPRRPAVPGERYTGARTARPQGAVPPRRDQIGVLRYDDDDAPAQRPVAAQRPPVQPDANNRPVPPQGATQGQRPPVRLDANGRPIPPQMPPQGQRPPVRLDENGRPIPPQGQRPPVRLDANGRPIPQQPQRPPVRLDQNGRPIPPQAQRPMPAPDGEEEYAPRQQEAFDPRRRQRPESGAGSDRFDPRRNVPEPQPRASVERPRYDFEEDMEEDDRPRRGGALIPLLVVLLVIGTLLAGILLPDWAGMGGGLGTAMNKIKTAVTDVFANVKDLISPEEAGVKSFSVNPETATAPVELVFTVQASATVTEIRIVDQNGTELLSKMLNDSDLLDGTVTKNSKYNIWTIRHSLETGYTGLFTAQSRKKDGTWDEGITLDTGVTIAEPVAVEPPVQDFTADTTEGSVPANVGFTVVTSVDVNAVEIINDYGDVISQMTIDDAGSQMTESDDTRTWSLTGDIETAYTGSFYAGYRTASDADYVQSDYELDVTLTAEADATGDSTETDANLTGDNAAGDGTDATPATDGADSLSSLGGDGTDLTGGDTVSLMGADGTEPTGDAAGVVGGDMPAEDLTADAATAAPDAAGDAAATDAAGDAAATDAPAATPAPKETPAPTPLPMLTVTADDAAAPAALKLATKKYLETKATQEYARENKVVINDPFQYAVWDQSGVLTFRGDPFRQNAAYGTLEKSPSTLTELWKVPVEGSIKAKSASLTGVGWPGQAIIVKWPTQLRALLGLTDAAKSKQALKEAIVGAHNGKIYFLDLVTGEATREAMTVDWPSNGSLSMQTNAAPMLAVGQHIGVLAKKTLDNGLHLLNLLTNKELTLLKGKEKLMQSNYSGFNGAPVFDKTTGTMVVGGENGLLYTMEPNADFDYVVGTLKIKPSVQKYAWLAGKQKAKNTNIDGSVAMYGAYAYFGDAAGVVQCVDVNTLTPVWAVDTGDNVDATIALDMESDSAVSLYTANTLLNQGRSGVCTIRKLDALSGKQLWAFTVPDLVYTTEAEVGCYASPVVGQSNLAGLVYFTATNGTKGATLYALDKASGTVKWTLALTSPTLSSPVAVYAASGDGFIVQAEGNGKLHLVNGLTGAEVTSLQLSGSVEASPAVYRNVLVIGTTGADPSYIYGIKLE